MNNEIYTKNLYLAAYLHANGVEVTPREEPPSEQFAGKRQFRFCYRPTKTAEKYQAEFYNPLSLGYKMVHAIRYLKDVVHNS
jgi:hypothetical protein